MKTFVTDEQMNAVRHRLHEESRSQLLAMHKKHQEQQEVLVSFVSDHLHDLREEAADVGLHVFHVIMEAFSEAGPRPVQRPMISQILTFSDETLAQEASAVELHAVRYLEEALAKGGDATLFDDEQTFCTHIIQIAILCLHMACEERANPDSYS